MKRTALLSSLKIYFPILNDNRVIQIISHAIKTFAAAQSLINQGAAISGRWLTPARVSSSYWVRWLHMRDAKHKCHAHLDKNYLLSSYSVSDAALLQVFC